MPLHSLKEQGIVTNYRNRGKADKSGKLKEYKISNKLVAKWFGYNSDRAFNSSSAKERILRGIDRLINHIENQRAK